MPVVPKISSFIQYAYLQRIIQCRNLTFSFLVDCTPKVSMFWLFNKSTVIFHYSVLLLTIEMTSKCSKLKWNRQEEASSFTVKFWLFLWSIRVQILENCYWFVLFFFLQQEPHIVTVHWVSDYLMQWLIIFGEVYIVVNFSSQGIFIFLLFYSH